jgi:hypothetical protein
MLKYPLISADPNGRWKLPDLWMPQAHPQAPWKTLENAFSTATTRHHRRTKSRRSDRNALSRA